MRYKLLTIIVIAAALIMFYIINSEEDIPGNYMAHLEFSKEIESVNGEDPQEGAPGERKVFHWYVSEKHDRLVTWIEEPWASVIGSGSIGNTIISDIEGNDPRRLDRFLTELDVVEDTMQESPSQDYIVHQTLSVSGSCFSRSTQIIDLENKNKIELKAPHQEQFEDEPYDEDIVTDAFWENETTVVFMEPQFYCIEESEARPMFESWQYDIETGEYSLVE